jgi:2-polyprenyl-6-methoxyphenol hydroxylase-like FAD-dependent oxidoreductase
MDSASVLVVGAGPTGLALALWLSTFGVRVRIVDKNAEPGTTSRALVVHARTLEFYRQLGFADLVVDRGVPFVAVNLWVAGQKVGRVALGEIGEGLTPFPHMLVFPQDEHEGLLTERLAACGVQVERRTALVGFDDLGDRVRARLRRSDGSEETCESAYLAGCDGAHSTVRERLGIGFHGGTYQHLFYIADVQGSGPAMDGELHVALDEADLMGAFPMKGAGRARLIGTVAEDAEHWRDEIGWDDVSRGILERLGIEVPRVHWFSTYRVHHRVATFFREQRAFLLGDAAHIHSPVGGQGMNTGIGDAVNLAWKLSAVLTNQASAQILDTYEPERMAFARRLVATTDRVFSLATSRGSTARAVRMKVVPRLVPAMFRLGAVRRFMFRTVSQTSVRYRESALSEGRAGRVHAGDRLPWVTFDGADGHTDNFMVLASLEWQVHVYGRPGAAIAEVCRARGVALRVFPWRRAFRRVGLARDAVYLVRPDGHVGLADAEASPATLERYLDVRNIRLRPELGRRAHAA